MTEEELIKRIETLEKLQIEQAKVLDNIEYKLSKINENSFISRFI